jgi:hypothetical protein
MNVVPLSYFPLYHGYALLMVYIAALIVLPFAGLVCSLRDFREVAKERPPPDRITAFRAWFIAFRKNDMILIWCFLAGCGLLLYGGATVFFLPSMPQFVCAVVMILAGVALGIYAERNCAWFP